ncbi:dolichyl-phosphate beta-glucosyltransferase [Candidatus Omnitrophota bacterium]
MKKLTGIFLSVVVPAYNEEKRIIPTLEKMQKYLKRQKYPYEIIVVDDQSRDKTREVVRRFIKDNSDITYLRGRRNKGKGYSVKTGMLHARGDYVLFSDADNSTPIKEVEKLLPLLKEGGYDIAIGSRALADSNVRVPQAWPRRTMGRIFNLFVQLIATPGIKDTQCGFKCFKHTVIYRLFRRQKILGFCFDVEILFMARKYNYKIKEVPIRWFNSPRSQVNMVVSPLTMMRDLVRIRTNDWKKPY